MSQGLIDFLYIPAAILFIFGIKMLGSATTARRGNLVSAMGMGLAGMVTLARSDITGGLWAIFFALAIGAAIGVYAARTVKMTQMPEMVALFNGFGGAASLLVAWAEYNSIAVQGWENYLALNTAANAYFSRFIISIAILIGGITFTGSLVAWAKLAGKLDGKPILFPNQQQYNLYLGVAILVVVLLFTVVSAVGWAYVLLIFAVLIALALGIMLVIPIGGGDMPVVISLLNSFSGLAASAAGFAIGNNVLIVAGCLVGASGLILTVIMCKAMNRTLRNVLFSGFGATEQKAGTEVEGELKPISADDAYYILEAAQSVVFVPGYGMAVAQAQHAVRELADLLEENGAEVKFAIHPVAGRMPGHMNVLLAEADVPYEQLVEMDDVNPTMDAVDVAVVIGANDVVNPAAAQDEFSPIYGMPIIEVHRAKTTFCLKRGSGTGFSGLQNQLFLMPNTRMLYGDAKASISNLVASFKE